MAIKILTSKATSEWPKEEVCPHCDSVLQVGSVEDLDGVCEKDTFYQIWFVCPVSGCGGRVYMSDTLFSKPEINQICDNYADKLIESYYAK